MNPLGYANFIRHGEHIFRTEATIQWGNSKDLLGLLIMLNPGSCQLTDEEVWQKFISNTSTHQVNGKIELDKTMKAAVKILEATHPGLNGVLVIHNVFNLRDQESTKAISMYDDFFTTRDKVELRSNFGRCVRKEYRDILHTDLSKDYINNFPWVWLAWTVNKRVNLDARRKQILNCIPQNKDRFAIYSTQAEHQRERELYTKHVSPRNPRDIEDYERKMIEIMTDYWNRRVRD